MTAFHYSRLIAFFLTCIFAISSGCGGGGESTNSPATLVSILVTPDNKSITKGVNTPLNAIGTFADGTSKDITSSAVWSSDSPLVVNVSSLGVASGVSTGVATISASSSGVLGKAKLTVTPATLVSILVTPDNKSIAKGVNSPLNAIGTFTDGTSKDITSSAVWSSDSPLVVNVSSLGVASGVSTGVATISASSSGVLGKAKLTVTPAILFSISVTPPSPTLAKGLKQFLVATGTFSDGTSQDISATVNWVSLTPSVATVTSLGLSTAVSLGKSIISASLNGVSGSCALNVTAAVLKEVTVTPMSTSIPKGLTQLLTATGTYSDGTSQILSSVVIWSSDALSVATVSTSGLASSVTVGAAKISARYGGVIGNATIYVTPVKIQSIEVLPSKPSLAIGLTTQLTAYGTFSDGTTQQLTTGVVWTSDAISKATVDNTGLVRGVTIGTAIVKATFDGVTVSTAVTITAATLQSISVTPQSASIANGFTTQLIASGKYSDGSVKDLTGLVIWTSDVISVATVNSSGLVSSVSIGIANIAAKYNGVTGTTTLTVTPASLKSISITPAIISIPKGRTELLTATGIYSDGTIKNLSNLVTWKSQKTSVAIVDVVGNITAKGEGSSNISATYSGIARGADVTVTPAELSSFTVQPDTFSIAKGLTKQFSVTLLYTDGTSRNYTSGWSSDANSVATVNSGGLVTAIGKGKANITAHWNGFSARATLTVTDAVLQSISISP